MEGPLVFSKIGGYQDLQEAALDLFLRFGQWDLCGRVD